jgi:hypothetical protein
MLEGFPDPDGQCKIICISNYGDGQPQATGKYHLSSARRRIPAARRGVNACPLALQRNPGGPADGPAEHQPPMPAAEVQYTI